MAVTYAWRLDSDKFAYIVSPSGALGYVSDVQLTGSDLKKVAETAENRFGNGGSSGLSGYTQAFAEMELKIAAKWPNLEYADMLSADMYYYVDAQNCADLRGVGIKGTMYLGSLLNPEDGGIEPTNVSYYASGASINNVTILPGLPGYTDIYGIYLTDQIENENDAVEAATSAPEYMFVVRNGKDGEDGEDGEISGEGSEIIEELRTEISGLTEQVENLNETVSQLSASISQMEAFLNEKGYDTIVKNITNLQQDINEINYKIDNLQPGTGGGGSTGGGSISIKPLSGENSANNTTSYYILVSNKTQSDNMDIVYAVDYAKANKYGIVIGDNIQVSSGGILQSQDKIYAGNGFYQATTNIENLPK